MTGTFLVMAERPVRNLAVDFYRVSGVVLIVLGHWLAGAVTYHDGYFGRQNPLVDQPWTQWLTWPFQAVPTFFLAAGYAGAVSWTHRRDIEGAVAPNLAAASTRPGARTVDGVRRAGVGSCSGVGRLPGGEFDSGICGLGGGDAPVVPRGLSGGGFADADCNCRTTPLGTFGARGAGNGCRGGRRCLAGWPCPLSRLAQLFALLGSSLSTRNRLAQRVISGAQIRAWLAAGSSVALALLIGLGPYPVSMIGVPGQSVQNSEPPSVAMLAFACAQAGLVIALAPALNRALRAGLVQRVLARANSNVMALYLWHMIPVVIVAIVGYPAGLLPQPVEGTAQWWLARLEWVVVLGLVTAVELALLWWGRRFFAAPLPVLATFRGRWAEPIMLAGAFMAAYGLAFVAAEGFAPYGHFPWLTALIFAIGVLLVALCPAVYRPLVGIHSLTSREVDQ